LTEAILEIGYGLEFLRLGKLKWFICLGRLFIIVWEEIFVGFAIYFGLNEWVFIDNF